MLSGVTVSSKKHATGYRSANDVCIGNPYFILSKGLLKPPRRFMYCRHVRCLCTFAVSSSTCPMPLPWVSAVIPLVMEPYLC
jgi:hypothetical protein